METERITLSQRERDRLKVLHEVQQKHLSQVAAAERLKVTDRQVRRMLDAVGHPVRQLHRSEYAGLTVEGLEPGAWRELEPSEVQRLTSG